MNQMTELYEHAIKWSPHAILATVIKVEGSAYRKEGAMMLFGKDRQMGTISAGCLESDLAIQADEMLEEEIHSQTLVYDMSAEDDLGWGSGAGCNGKIHILLEHVNGLLRTNLVTALTYVAERREVNLVKILNEDRQVTDSIVSKFDDQTTFDQFTMNMKPKRKSALYAHKSLPKEVFVQYVQPKERLVIFGAEPDVPPLALMAHQVGLEVIIWDWRQSYLKQALFPNATLYGEMSITSFLKKIAFHSRDSVVIMTHNFMIDKEILQTLRMNDNIHYLGVLGPKKRTKRLLNTTSIPKSIHSPVGIAIGAEGPEEIAISILAEVIQQNRQALDKGVSSLEAGKNSRNISRSG